MTTPLLQQLQEMQERVERQQAQALHEHFESLDPSALEMRPVTSQEFDRILDIISGQSPLTESDDELLRRFPELLE